MKDIIKVSTPSRICLLGEHQDYLGLDVIAAAINLRFSAEVSLRDDNNIRILIRDERIDSLNAQNSLNEYQQYIIDFTKPIVYKNKRDYLNSTVNILLKNGYELRGVDVKMDSQIPIGKGMCSSSTMIIALIRALLESIQHPDKDDVYKTARLGFAAEVLEFNEPGGMMDHYTSAVGGLVHLNFEQDVKVSALDAKIDGCFILFDSLQQKDTTTVLASSKIPTLEAVDILRRYGISSIRDFYNDPSKLELLEKLDNYRKQKLMANIDNYKIFRSALEMLTSGNFEIEQLGKLLYRHYENLRDGLGVSTDTIDKIMNTALANGALGGKINGSGGGGCLYVCARLADAEKIMESVNKLGYPARLLNQDTGVRRDN